MRTFIFLPPLPRMSGGLAVLQKLGWHLHRAGFDIFFVAREPVAWLAESGQGDMPPVLMWDGGDGPLLPPPLAPLSSDDIWLIPEGWPHALLPGLRASCRTVIYVQNWAYFLSEWPAGLEPANLPVHYVAVSHPVAWHIREVTGRHAELLRPGIDTSLFHPAAEKADSIQTKPVIGWMPRKNKALARQIREIMTARCAFRHNTQPTWVEIASMTQTQVAETLRRCDIFLATGFPEGCPLPPLEAMASGCLCAGFSGFGGWDYMREPSACSLEDQSGRLPLWTPEGIHADAEPRPANGFWASDGDVIGVVEALEKALALPAAQRHIIQQAARQTAEIYSLTAQARRIEEMWTHAAEGRLFVME